MPDTRTEQAKQLIVRYIRDQKMKRGDKMPGQVFLRKKFNLGSTTIISAIHGLKVDSVLEVRDKVGVYVVDPDADGHIGRSVAVTAVHLENSVFYSVMSAFLQTQLTKQGCLMRLFCCKKKPDPAKTHCSFDDFPGLKRCVDDGQIQGIIHIDDFVESTERYLLRRKIPSLKLGGAIDTVKCGLYFNQEDVLRRAVGRLKEHGCVRPALLTNVSLYPYIKEEYDSLIAALWGKDAPVNVFSGTSDDAEKLAWDFASLKPQLRPDGIVVLDDIQGGTFSSALARYIPVSEMPFAAVLRNQQLCIPFVFPNVVYYNLDIMELAELASSMIMNMMKNGELAPESFFYTPKEADPVSSQFFERKKDEFVV